VQEETSMSWDPSVIVGSKLKRAKVSRDSVTLVFGPSGEWRRRIVGGEYRKTSTDWCDPLIGLTVMAVREYQEGTVIDFGLRGLLIGNDGNFTVVQKQEQGGVQ